MHKCKERGKWSGKIEDFILCKHHLKKNFPLSNFKLSLLISEILVYFFLYGELLHISPSPKKEKEIKYISAYIHCPLFLSRYNCSSIWPLIFRTSNWKTRANVKANLQLIRVIFIFANFIFIENLLLKYDFPFLITNIWQLIEEKGEIANFILHRYKVTFLSINIKWTLKTKME